MFRFPVAFLIQFLALAPAFWIQAHAQQLSVAEQAVIRQELAQKVVSIRVRGTASLGGGAWRPGGDGEGEHGTAVIFVDPEEKAVQLLTARHVVGHDHEFADDPDANIKDRHVYLSLLSEVGKVEVQEAARRVKVHSSEDVARIYINAPSRRAASIADDSPAISEGQTVYVMPWPVGANTPEFIPAVVGARSPAQDGQLIRLKIQSYKSWSGAPVFNSEGAVVAILVESVTPANLAPFSRALPVRAFRNFVPLRTMGSVTRETPPETNVTLRVPNGEYTAIRGYRSEKAPHCLASYAVNAVFVEDGRITFQSDGRTWRGSIDQRSGKIDIGYNGIHPKPKNDTYITGAFDKARMYNGFCGNGYFSLQAG